METIEVHSTSGRITPAIELGFGESGRSAADTALPVAGAGYAADRTSLQQSSLSNGVFMFDTRDCFGLELHFVQTGLAAVASTVRVFRELAVYVNYDSSQRVIQYTYRHLCDISLSASSAQAGTGSASSGIISTDKYSIPTVSSDAGLSPLGTRVMQGITAGAAGSIVIDPMCAPRIMVVTKKDAADYVGVYASKWTGL